MKRFTMTIALTCILSSSALAGDVPSVGVTAPLPDEPPAPTAPGEVPSGGFTQELTETGLTLIQLALSGVL
jgi:hypothetical protein